mmetsp:Transcript_374/g.535  ORF Transcript_374/g.535 Transcript_374/m.535 type:complete len:987 (+) Transcript_374:11-2971(+)
MMIIMSSLPVNNLRLSRHSLISTRAIATTKKLSNSALLIHKARSFRQQNQHFDLLNKNHFRNNFTSCRAYNYGQTQTRSKSTLHATTPISATSDSNINDVTRFNHDRDEALIDELKSKTNRLISKPIGSLTSAQMKQTVDLFHSWIYMHSGVGAEHATQVFHRIVDENVVGSPRAQFNNNMIQELILMWREVDPKQCTAQSHEIIEKLRALLDEKYIPYNLIISTLSKCREVDAAKYSSHLLQQLLDRTNKDYFNGSIQNKIKNTATDAYYDHTKDIADTLSFNQVISSWMHLATNEPNAGEEALRVFNRMKGSYRLGNPHSKPNKLSFSMTFSALIKCNGRMSAFSAEDVLQDMIYFYREENDDAIKPEKDMFDTVLHALVKWSHLKNSNSACEDALNRSFKLLRQMDELGITIDTLTYNSVIAIILRNTSKKNNINDIQTLIQTMNRDSSTGKNMKAKPDTISYNSLIKAYSDNYDARNAEAILRQMIAEFEKGNINIRPDTTSWNTVIEAHAKSKVKDAAENASRILHEMTEYHKKGNDHIRPDKVSISLMLIAMARGPKFGNKDVAKQAVTILDRMEAMYMEGNELMKPDALTYTQAINCIAKSGAPDSGIIAIDLLLRMKDLHKRGREDLKPDIVTFNAVLSAMASSQSKGISEYAEQLLNEMEKSGDSSISPNTTSYSSVITAWANSDSPVKEKKVERLLQRMEEGDANVAPNTVSFSAALHVFAKSNSPGALERSMNILKQMEDKFESGDSTMLPNAYTYSSVMEVISNSPNKQIIAEEALKLLKRMINFSKKLETKKNYTIAFNTAIKGIERSAEKKKAIMAEKIMKIMKETNDSKELKASPTIRTYNAIIRCCAFNRGSLDEKRAAFDIACKTLGELRDDENIVPDSYTYPSMFKSCELLLGTNKEGFDIVKDIFNKCCEDGMVDGLILKNLCNYKNLPRAVLSDMLKSNNPQTVRIATLPKEWSRNSNPVQRRRKI